MTARTKENMSRRRPGPRPWLLTAVLALLLALTSAVREAKFYDILGVAPDADEATIKKAYRRQAL